MARSRIVERIQAETTEATKIFVKEYSTRLLKNYHKFRKGKCKRPGRD